MLTDGTWTYTWEHGRELATMSNGSTTWTNTYNTDGLRTKRTDGSTTYSYVYNGSSLSQMSVGTHLLNFAYDASGAPMAVTYDGTTYYYVTNLQGDIIAILDSDGEAVVKYTYDAWGKLLTTTGSMAATLGIHNPLRYRGYVYDPELGMYYLQSRYYAPELGRFINADTYISNGQGFVGMNMFAYCINNPVNGCDPCGTCFHRWDFWNDCEECGGKTLGDKVSNAVAKIKNHHRKVRETEDEIRRMQNQLVSDTVKKGLEIHSLTVQMQAEAQYEQDMTVIQVAEFAKEEPLMAVDVISTTIGLAATYYLAVAALNVISIPAGLAIALNVAADASTIWGAYRTYSGAWDEWQQYINIDEVGS